MRILTLIKEFCPESILNSALRVRSRLRNWRFAQSSPGEVFAQIYRNPVWGGTSVSGAGSDLGQTESVRKELPQLLKAFDIKRLLDLPCGDFNWMQHVELAGCDYTGGEIVRDLVEANTAKYGKDNRRFRQLDLMNDALPPADLLLCRDCLIHLSFQDAQAAIANIARGEITYLLTTTYPLITRNTDIITGDFRAINLQLAPFRFPKPLAVINEDLFPSLESNPNFIRQLGLWRVCELSGNAGKR